MGQSQQERWVVALGKKWYGYCRRTVMDVASNEAAKTKIVPVDLGDRSQMTKSAARQALGREIMKLTGQHNGNKDHERRFCDLRMGSFATLLSLWKRQWKEETYPSE